ncbi:hypothetical protein LTR15_004774 [Elasticomyces elasticus]|nr:hypothetical protein LTR15_004774 [Elasticomyces elasticus]
MAIENCKGNANGLGLVDQGKEHTIEELGDYDESSVKKYSMAWLNPVTDEKAFMVHGIAARKLYIRSGPDEQPRVIEDLTEIRKFLADIQLRILKPEYICMAPVEEGDIVMWDNYGVSRPMGVNLRGLAASRHRRVVTSCGHRSQLVVSVD